MNFDSTPKPVRDSIAQQIGVLLIAAAPADVPGSCMPPAGLKLRESVRELILDLPSDLSQGARIEDFTRRQLTWHHQLGSDTELYGYARTIQHDGPDSPHSLIEIVPSAEVAALVEAAIVDLDAEPEKFERLCAPDAELSLLYIPRNNFYGFVPEPTSRAEAGWKLGGVYEFSQLKDGAAFGAGAAVAGQYAGTALDREQLLARLKALPSAFGVDSRAPRRVRRAGLGDRVSIGLRRLMDRWREPKVPR